ncbi:hypothetical protein IMY05_006G0174700 [Salix suchowensis]|nr:hypothetical protein IMY05_006G0174700 [Salix suchowensis]
MKPQRHASFLKAVAGESPAELILMELADKTKESPVGCLTFYKHRKELFIHPPLCSQYALGKVRVFKFQV